MWLDREATSGGNPFAIAPYLDEVTERQNERQGYTCTGRLRDYQVCITNSGVALLGSLAKYFLPSNVYTLTRATVQQAIEQMSDQLHTDVSAAKVLRADVSTVIPTMRPPADYYSCLGGKARFERVQATPDTLYYSTHTRQLVFYDKTKEAAAKRAFHRNNLVDHRHRDVGIDGLRRLYPGFRLGLRRVAPSTLHHTNAKLVRQPLACLLKRPLLMLHGVGNDVAAFVAAEAVAVVLARAFD
jgi:hypothetical protein